MVNNLVFFLYLVYVMNKISKLINTQLRSPENVIKHSLNTIHPRSGFSVMPFNVQYRIDPAATYSFFWCLI